MSEVGLTARVCANDPSLHFSNAQAQAFRDIWAYLYKGPVLCALCYVVWFNNVIRDVRAAVVASAAAVRLRRPGEATKISAANRIEALSTARVAWFVSVQVHNYIGP